MENIKEKQVKVFKSKNIKEKQVKVFDTGKNFIDKYIVIIGNSAYTMSSNPISGLNVFCFKFDSQKDRDTYVGIMKSQGYKEVRLVDLPENLRVAVLDRAETADLHLNGAKGTKTEELDR